MKQIKQIFLEGKSPTLREHAMKIINFKKSKMKLLAKEQQESWKFKNLLYLSRKLENKYLKDKKLLQS